MKALGINLEKLAENEGYEAAINAQDVIHEIKNNPSILIEITDSESSICPKNCKVRPNLWHHCNGEQVRNYEAEEAAKHGLKIGEIKPANKIFKTTF